LSTPNQPSLHERVDALGARFVECSVADFSSNARGKTPAREDFLAAGGCRMASIVLGLTVTSHTPEGMLGQLMPSSYQDLELRADPATMCAQYARPGAATVLCEPHGRLRAESSGREFDANALSPRAALRRVLERLAHAGLRATVAPELEFYLVSRRSEERPHELVAARSRPGSPARELCCEPDSVERAGHFAPYFDELYEACEGLRIPMAGYAHESAFAQFEVNFRPGEPLAQADAVFRFKRLARQVAERHGFLASFLAKPFLDQPGCGMHWHFSLQQGADGANAFLAPGGEHEGPRLLQFVAGLQRHAAAAAAIHAPYDHSYDRIRRSDSSPSRANWGMDDRMVAFRIPRSSPANRRVENRLPGGDSSPYLVVATTLGLGLAGIEGAWTPLDDAPTLPASLGEALDRLDGDATLRRILGDPLVDLFLAVKRCESRDRNACAAPREDWDLPFLTEQA
jgi:glutamine synthetase